MTGAGTVLLGDGIRATVSRGDGDGVLWFHGYTMDATVWPPLWDLLPGWRHIGLDLPGHGGSRPLRAGDDLDSLADMIGGLAVGAGVRHLVAMSFGTVLALQVAIRHPRQFATLVLSAPALAGGPHDRRVELRYEMLALLHSRLGPGPHMTALWMSTPPDIFAGVNARPQLRESMASVIDRHGWAELHGGAMMALTSGTQDAEALRQIGADTLIVLGSGELAAFRQCAELIEAAVPRARCAEVRGAGHLALVEVPGAVAPMIDAHLRDT